MTRKKHSFFIIILSILIFNGLTLQDLQYLNTQQITGNTYIGTGNSGLGSYNNFNGNNNLAKGNSNDIKGQQNLVNGNENKVTGSGNIISGQGNIVMSGSDLDIEQIKKTFTGTTLLNGIQSKFAALGINPLTNVQQKTNSPQTVPNLNSQNYQPNNVNQQNSVFTSSQNNQQKTYLPPSQSPSFTQQPQLAPSILQNNGYGLTNQNSQSYGVNTGLNNYGSTNNIPQMVNSQPSYTYPEQPQIQNNFPNLAQINSYAPPSTNYGGLNQIPNTNYQNFPQNQVNQQASGYAPNINYNGAVNPYNQHNQQGITNPVSNNLNYGMPPAPSVPSYNANSQTMNLNRVNQMTSNVASNVYSRVTPIITNNPFNSPSFSNNLNQFPTSYNSYNSLPSNNMMAYSNNIPTTNYPSSLPYSNMFATSNNMIPSNTNNGYPFNGNNPYSSSINNAYSHINTNFYPSTNSNNAYSNYNNAYSPFSFPAIPGNSNSLPNSNSYASSASSGANGYALNNSPSFPTQQNLRVNGQESYGAQVGSTGYTNGGFNMLKSFLGRS